MNYIQEINTQCQHLPENLQKEVVDFIGYLTMRYKLKLVDQDNTVLTDDELEQATAVLKAHRGVSLEQMDTAIKNRGGHL